MIDSTTDVWRRTLADLLELGAEVAPASLGGDWRGRTTRELLAYRLLSLHNLTFYFGLMAAMRRAVADGAFGPFRSRFLDRYGVESVGGSDPTSTETEA